MISTSLVQKSWPSIFLPLHLTLRDFGFNARFKGSIKNAFVPHSQAHYLGEGKKNKKKNRNPSFEGTAFQQTEFGVKEPGGHYLHKI